MLGVAAVVTMPAVRAEPIQLAQATPQPAPPQTVPQPAPAVRTPVVRVPSRPPMPAGMPPGPGQLLEPTVPRRPMLPPTSVVQPLSPLEAFGASAAPQPGALAASRAPAEPTEVTPAGAPPPPDQRLPRCLRTDRIRETTVRDDRTIRFRLAGGDVVDVKLRNRCYGLSFDGSFYYHLNPNRQLCERLDWIVARSGSRCQIEAIELVPDASGKKRKADRD
jgi:hypothetical protein